jgi:hypothetical protein
MRYSTTGTHPGQWSQNIGAPTLKLFNNNLFATNQYTFTLQFGVNNFILLPLVFYGIHKIKGHYCCIGKFNNKASI